MSVLPRDVCQDMMYAEKREESVSQYIIKVKGFTVNLPGVPKTT